MAKIEGIRIANYRVLKDLTLGKLWNTQHVQPLAPLSVVIGKNGVGKSCTAPGFLDTRLRYAAWRSSYCWRASSGVRYASFSRRQHWL